MQLLLQNLVLLLCCAFLLMVKIKLLQLDTGKIGTPLLKISNWNENWNPPFKNFWVRPCSH